MATLTALVVVVALVVTRSLGDRALRFERWVFALFLAGMPLVYVSSWFVYASSGLGSRDASTSWLAIELVGVPVYGALAVIGLRRSPWVLAAGILAHGVFWDAWHIGWTPFVPDWYAVGCLVTDVAMAIYVAVRSLPSARTSLHAAPSGPA
jgi:hypothetical protein